MMYTFAELLCKQENVTQPNKMPKKYVKTCFGI